MMLADPRGLRRGSAAAPSRGLQARIPPGAWMSVVVVVCCQSSPRGADHSSRGVLPIALCLSVIVKRR